MIDYKLFKGDRRLLCLTLCSHQRGIKGRGGGGDMLDCNVEGNLIHIDEIDVTWDMRNSGNVLTQNMRFMIGLPCQRKNHFILLSFSNKYADTLRTEQYNINKSLTKPYNQD